ncbi:MAG: cupin domain-containing protein [Bacteroidales bacterium]|nr:cupin domain-containing protein [Bacteroidales bacterium]
MVRKSSQMQVRYREHVADGKGLLFSQDIFLESEMADKARMCSKITLPAGSSIGTHAHVQDAELYYVLKGELKVVDNGKEYSLHTGDAVFTALGGTHSVSNETDSAAEFLAVIIK